MKTIAICLLLLLLAIGGTLVWLRNNVDSLIRHAIESYGSAMIQAPVRVGSVQIKAADGRGELVDLEIGNPPGFKTPYALKVSHVALEIDLSSLARRVVVIKQIAVTAPAVIYEKAEHGTNFDAIQKNIATYLGPGSKDKPGKRLIIDAFTLSDAKAEASAVFMGGKTVGVALPDIALNGIGRRQGQGEDGVTPGEFGKIVAAAIVQKLGGAYSFDRALKATGNAINKTGEVIKGLFK